ncbi:MAG: NADH-quinone oxidoreductase subunit H [Thermoplasmata archaeon]|mgnify:CR=1 FL=1|nr:MAG: NADH-quinone oxidoreductase subunit H [Thermoplasmata archaeon]
MDIGTVSITILTVIFGAIGVTLFGIIIGLLYKGIDRKIAAHMQGRVGPPIRQPFLDVIKLFVKENIVPDNAIPWVFHLAPIIGLIASITILLYLPIGGFPAVLDGIITSKGDLILLLYLLIIPSLALVTGGFSSGSPYAIVGAQREMATMIAYEFPLAIIIVTIAWRLSLMQNVSHVFTLSTITSIPLWNILGPLGFIGMILLLLTLIIVTPAELSKIPFDAPEAETEIAGGLLVEYSGRNLAMFYLTDAVKTVAMGSIIIALFFPYNLSPILSMNGYPAYIIDFLFYLLKLFLVILFSVTLIRVGVARLKIDQIVYTYWVPLTLLALIGLICIMWDQTIMTQFGIPSVVEILGLT